jgi:EF-P beta-lysylation protein EpmB
MLSNLVPSWTQILRKNFTKMDSLADFLELTPEQRQQLAYQRPFVLNVPKRLADKMAKGTLEDPLFRQFVPLSAENNYVEGYQADPLAELACRNSSKLLHKYSGRVLLVCTSACAMHCRYCFRQHFPYATQQPGFTEEIAAIAADSSIREVILSGGDPLSLSDRALQQLLDALAVIPHVKRIRFHSRFPIGIPERIDDSFCAMIKALPQQVWFVIHANHPKELDNDVLHHLKLLKDCGAVLLHQAVLLRGVNDSVVVLKQLCETLVDHGISPYYIHQLDRVDGAAHFEVPESEGLLLLQSLQAQLSGYAVPRYVREVAGATSKTPLPMI